MRQRCTVTTARRRREGTLVRVRRTLQVAVAVAVAALVSPLAAFALFSVTTAPVIQPAPALALPVLVALAIALIGVGTYCLRTRSAGAVAGFALVVALSVFAAFSYAGTGVVIQDADCNMETMHSFYGGVSPLTSLCANPIKIVAITCSDPPPPACHVGEILLNCQTCSLECVP